jgi:hypothetical protein
MDPPFNQDIATIITGLRCAALAVTVDRLSRYPVRSLHYS